MVFGNLLLATGSIWYKYMDTFNRSLEYEIAMQEALSYADSISMTYEVQF
jgi:hypothetical protein